MEISFARTLQIDGAAPWLYHPLAIFGLVPLSDANGPYVLIASFGLLAGQNALWAAVLVSLLGPLLFFFVGAATAAAILKHPTLVLLGGLILASMPQVLAYSYYGGGIAREYALLVFSTIFLLLLVMQSLVTDGRTWKRFLVLIVMLVFLGLSFHLVTIGFISLLVAGRIGLTLVRGLRQSQPLRAATSSNSAGIFCIAIVFIALYVWGLVFFPLSLPGLFVYQRGTLFQGSGEAVVTLNMATNYFRYFGIFLFLVPVGIWTILEGRSRRELTQLSVACVVAASPILLFAYYAIMSIQPLVFVCTLMALRQLTRPHARFLVRAAIIIAVAGGLVVAQWYTVSSYQRVNGIHGSHGYLDAGHVEAGLYLDQGPSAIRFYGNDYEINRRVSSMVDNPLGAADYDVMARGESNLDLSRLRPVVTLQEFISQRGLYSLPYQERSTQRPPDAKVPSYYLVNNYLHGSTSSWNGATSSPSPLVDKIERTDFRLFVNSDVSLYWYA